MAFSDKKFPYNIFVRLSNGEVRKLTDGKVGTPKDMMQDEAEWKDFYHSNCPGLYQEVKARIEGDEYNPRCDYERELQMSEGKDYYVFFRYKDGVCSLWNNGEKMSFRTAEVVANQERMRGYDDLIKVYPRQVKELEAEMMAAGIENRNIKDAT